MRKLLIYICMLAVSSAVTAQSLLVDDFTGLSTGSSLVGQSSWVKGGSGPEPTIQNSSPLVYPGYNGGSGEYVLMPTGIATSSRVYKPFTTTAAGTNTFYYSFLLNLSATTATGDYFITLGDPGTGTSYFGRIFAKTNGAGYNLGVTKLANVASAVFGTTVFNYNQTYLVVVRYTFVTGASNDEMYVWVNPSLSSEPSTGSALAFITTTASDPSNANVGNFHWHNRTANNPVGSFDGVRVAYGATSADAWTALNASSVATPSLSILSPLTSFGNTCINNEAGPNSFDITGSNLTTADVTVGALSGFTYSTTAGGTYTPSLSITQPGGTFSQSVYVKFTPTAVQSYNGNIPVAGGGVFTAVNVAASGSGVNDAPVVTSGAVSAITQTTATVAGTITSTGCSVVTGYGIEYSTTTGFTNGTGTQVSASNLSSGAFSADLTGLVTGTTYFFHAWATNSAGTSYSTEGSFTTATPDPQILVTALTSFGDVCLTTTAGPNSFTITGTNLTAADITVGALDGYSYSTTSAGVYTSSLTLTQTGGSFSQVVFVKLTAGTVQSYNGVIVVNGGGVAAPVDVAASGAGVNTPASLTTGAASLLTYNSATLAGSITATGCTNVTAYGIEYSSTDNFTPGAGTQVVSSNLSSGAFSSALSGLTPTTVYYYRAYATNAGGTAYGTQQTFTTAAVPISLTATALTAFGTACIYSTVGPNSFTINGAFLTNANINVGPFTGYSFSATAGGTYTPSLSLTQTGGTYSQEVFVKFNPTAVQNYNGNIPVSGGGFASTVNVPVSGSGVNTTATVTTGATTSLTTQSALVAGQVVTEGCSAVTGYGVEWSGINGFVNGSGTRVAGTGIASGNFTVALTGLVQGATYYYKTYAVNNGGTAYGAQQTFTVASIGNGFRLYPNPVERGTDMRITVKDIQPGYYGLLLFNSAGEKVQQWNMNIQSTFINQTISIPATLQQGVYWAYLVSDKKEMEVITVLVL